MFSFLEFSIHLTFLYAGVKVSCMFCPDTLKLSGFSGKLCLNLLDIAIIGGYSLNTPMDLLNEGLSYVLDFSEYQMA